MEKSLKTKIWILVLLAVTALAAVAVVVQRQADFVDGDTTARQPRMNVVLGLPTQPSNAGWFVGLENGYFAEHGVELVNQPHAIGLQALDAVIAGTADLALVADTPVLLAVMRGVDLSIVATTYSSRNYMALIARGDHGIAQPADLKGKKIGYVPSTNGHFFLYSFLLAHGLGAGQSQPIIIKPAESVERIDSGALDALVCWEPILGQAREAIGESAVVFHGPELYTTRFSLVGRTEYVPSHPAELQALIRGLTTANRFIQEQPQKARSILTNYLPGKSTVVTPDLVPGDYQTVLEQAQLITLEDQARWALKEKLVSPQPVPNFLRHMDLATLTAIAPDDVTLVR